MSGLAEKIKTQLGANPNGPLELTDLEVAQLKRYLGSSGNALTVSVGVQSLIGIPVVLVSSDGMGSTVDARSER